MDEQNQNSQVENAEVSENTEENTSGKKKWSWKRNVPLFVVEILVLVAAIGVLYVITTTTNEIERTVMDTEDIVINEEVEETIIQEQNTEETVKSKGYRNIALFGVDAREGNQLGKGSRSDTIIIASINMDTHEIKLVSVYRDTYLNLGNDSYNKCNTAYAKGGPEMAISMLNTNLDMDITDYVTIGFSGLMDAIDALGGIEMEVTKAEIKHLNNYQLSMSEEMGLEYTPVTETGVQTLNGLQATAYCRIRYTKGDDFRRAERQRDVLAAMMVKAKDAPLSSLTEAVTAVLPSVNTSLNVNEILSVLGTVAEYNVVASEGFPFAEDRTTARVGSKGDCVIPATLAENVIELHTLLYEKENYSPSKQVELISDEIAEQTDEYLN